MELVGEESCCIGTSPGDYLIASQVAVLAQMSGREW
jgi:hypothetical protein